MNGDGSARYGLGVDPNALKARFALLLRLPDDQLPLDVMCLLICQLAGDDIVIDDEILRLDDLAVSTEHSFAGIMSSLFGPHGCIRGNTNDYYSVDNSLLTRVLANGVGIPITMSVVALECARRVGVGMVGIGVPGHFIVRSGSDDDLFGDPFNGGVLLDRAGAQRMFHRAVGAGAVWHDSYLDPVSSREILFRILNNLRSACERSPQRHAMIGWVLELLGMFHRGVVFGPRAVDRAMARYN